MTINEMLNSDAYQRWESDRLGNDLFISDPKRASRIHEYAEEGMNGSTHEEIIQDWRDYVADAELPESVKEELLKEIESVEEWHIKNGTIDKVIG